MTKKEDLIYFLSLEVENVRCFGSPMQPLRLTDDNGKLTAWTLLIGENGLGKTTLSECLLWMQFVPSAGGTPKSSDNSEDGIASGPMEPSLPEAANDLIESLIRSDCRSLEIKAEFSQGIALGRAATKNLTDHSIKTGIKIHFKDEKLENYDTTENVYNSTIDSILGGKYKEPFIITYGASRSIGNVSIHADEMEDEESRSNFLDKRLADRTELYNAEEILRFFETRALKSKGKKNSRAQETLEESQFKHFKQIIADILPADEVKVKDLNFYDPPRGVCLNTFSGKDIPFSALSLGYRTTISLALDIAWRLFRKYPKSETPQNQPAIVLIDEIDLHLHPRWQRTIIKKLTAIFPGTQFIATSHSPLMVQAAADVNLAVLHRIDDKVCIENDLETVFGWRVDQLRVDQILYSPIFGVDHSRGPESEQLFRDRAKLLKKAKLTAKDTDRLVEISAAINDLPTVSNLEDLSGPLKASNT